MKNFLLSAFVIATSLSVTSLASASNSRLACYSVGGSARMQYDSIQILYVNEKVSEVKVHLRDNSGVLEDQNPVLTQHHVEPVCHGTLNGRYLCTSNLSSPFYDNFQNQVIESISFSDYSSGVMYLKNESAQVSFKEVNCF